MPRPLFRALHVLVFASAVAGVGCADSPERAVPGTQATSPARPMGGSRAEPPPAAAPPPSPCEALVEEFARTLREAPGRCDADADCACYPGGVGEAAGCGGVTDRETAVALHGIAARFRAADCRNTIDCAPWECRPTCQQGRCAR